MRSCSRTRSTLKWWHCDTSTCMDLANDLTLMYAAAVPIFARRLLDGKPITIFGDGGQTRDLINVRDVVRANLIASEHPNAAGKVFNVCTGVETRLLDLLEVL